MNDEGGMISIVFTVGLVIGMLVGISMTVLIETKGWRRRAIENNAAEWRIDPKTGASEFVWTSNEEKEEENER